MKSKTPLLLMEILIMLVVFSLAAAICLRAFSWADSQSRAESQRDAAWVQLQNAAEVLKHARGALSQGADTLGGTVTGDSWVMDFDENWNLTWDAPAYRLEVTRLRQENTLLGGAILRVTDEAGMVLGETEIRWQEVAP